MKKVTYRAVEIKAVNVEKLCKAIGGGRLVFAVDVGKEVPFAQMVNEKGEGLVTVKWKQPSQGAGGG